MVLWRLKSPAFWSERAGVADPDLVHGVVAGKES